MSLSHTSLFRRGAIALTAAGFVGASALGVLPAAAQQALNQQQCSDAISVANSIVQKYKGKISKDLINSFVKFSDSKCDLTTNFVTATGTQDNTAFGEFRLRLIALRTTDTAKPASLTR